MDGLPYLRACEMAISNWLSRADDSGNSQAEVLALENLREVARDHIERITSPKDPQTSANTNATR